MSEDKNILDDFLKRKLNSKQFELKESYWMKARKIIDEDRDKEQKGIFFFLFSMTTVLVVSIGLIFAESYQAVRKHTITAYTEKTGSASSSHSLIPVSNTFSDYFTETSPENKPANNDNLPSAETETVASSNEASSSVVNTKNSNKNTYASVSKERSAVNMTERKTSKKKQVSKHALLLSSSEQPGNNSAADEKAPQLAEESITGLHLLPDPYLLEGHFYKPYNPSRTWSDSSLKKKDIYLQAHLKAKQQRFLAVLAGVNCYNPSGSIVNAINFHAGMNYYYYIHPRVALGLGVVYSRLHQDLPERNYENISYSFGQVSGSTRIKTLRLDYIELPVNVYYNIYKKHYINAGASFGYLLQSTERIITTTDVQTQKKDNGYKQPINPYDIQLNAGYMVFLPKGFNLSAGYYFGLNDVSRNDWFKSGQLNRNSGIRVSVGYRLF